jgi:hypothetical protein
LPGAKRLHLFGEPASPAGSTEGISMQSTTLSASPATTVHPSELCTVPACLYGFLCAVVEELQERLLSGCPAAGPRRQLAAFAALERHMLAILTTPPAYRTPQMFEELRRLFGRAQLCTDRGTPIQELFQLAQPAPPGKFRIDVPSLCWANVARLCEALEQCVAGRREPKRLNQLRVAAVLENDLRQLIATLHRHQITWDESAGAAAGFFTEAEIAIGDELAAIYVEAERLPPAAEMRQ